MNNEGLRNERLSNNLLESLEVSVMESIFSRRGVRTSTIDLRTALIYIGCPCYWTYFKHGQGIFRFNYGEQCQVFVCCLFLDRIYNYNDFDSETGA